MNYKRYSDNPLTIDGQTHHLTDEEQGQLRVLTVFHAYSGSIINAAIETTHVTFDMIGTNWELLGIKHWGGAAPGNVNVHESNTLATETTLLINFYTLLYDSKIEVFIPRHEIAGLKRYLSATASSTNGYLTKLYVLEKPD